MSTTNIDGLGECGCCSQPWDQNERFAACWLPWAGRMLTGHPEYRSLKVSWTYTHRLEKRVRNEAGVSSMWPDGDNLWEWVNTKEQIENKWTGIQGDVTSLTLTDGSIPPSTGWNPVWQPTQGFTSPSDAIPYSDYNPDTPLLPADWPTDTLALPQWQWLRIVSPNTYSTTYYSLTYGEWWYRESDSLWQWNPSGFEDDTLPPPPAGVPYFIQRLTVRVKWETTGEHIYTKSEYAANWADLYARLSFQSLVDLRNSDDDFHWLTFERNADGEVVERRYYNSQEGIPKETYLWHDRWRHDAAEWAGEDGSRWWHDVGDYDEDDQALILFQPSGQYTEIVNGGTESAKAETYTGQGLNALPQSTYLYLSSYTAPLTDPGGERDGVDGIPDATDIAVDPFGQTIMLGNGVDHAGSIARITIVPLPPGDTTFALRKFFFDGAEQYFNENPTSCCVTILNDGSDAIQVQSDKHPFEFVRYESCSTGETRCLGA